MAHSTEAQSVSTQLDSPHSAMTQETFIVITKYNYSLKRKQRCSPMGLCEAFTCVTVGVLFAISVWPQWCPAWRDPSSSEPSREDPSQLGHHRLDLQQRWCERECPTLGQLPGLGGFPCKETCRCSPPLPHLGARDVPNS